MNCHATRAVLDLHAEGRLTSGRAAAVEGHLASCAACRALSAALPGAAAPGEAAPDTLKARLSAAMKASRGAPAETGPSYSFFPRDAAGVAWAAAALTLVTLVAGWNGAPTQSFDAGDEIAGRLP